MNFVPKPIGDKLIIRFEGDLTHDIAVDFENSLLKIIQKEKKSIIFDFSDVKYINIDVCVAFVNIYKHMALEQLDLIAVRVSEPIASVLDDLGFKDIFFFASDLSSAMNLSKKEESVESKKDEVNQRFESVSGGQQSSGAERAKSKDDVCENWAKKGILGSFIKKCGTCKFFKPRVDGKGECTK